MTKTVKIAAAAFLSAAALIIAGIGVDFSPGFSEGFVVSKAKAYWEGLYATGMDKSLTQDDFI